MLCSQLLFISHGSKSGPQVRNGLAPWGRPEVPTAASKPVGGPLAALALQAAGTSHDHLTITAGQAAISPTLRDMILSTGTVSAPQVSLQAEGRLFGLCNTCGILLSLAFSSWVWLEATIGCSSALVITEIIVPSPREHWADSSSPEPVSRKAPLIY